MMDEVEERVQSSYEHNYEHLVQVKVPYDAINVFKVNQNVKAKSYKDAFI